MDHFVKILLWIILFQVGVPIHEIGHVIGFWHEHQRSDRDSYITIRTENAYQSFTFVAEFLRLGNTDNHNIAYDYGSVLHYSAKVIFLAYSTYSISWWFMYKGKRHLIW